MRGLSVSLRLALAFVTVLTAVAITVVLALTAVPRLVASVNLFQTQLLQELSLFEDIRVLISDAVRQDEAYILSNGDDAYDEAFEDDVEEIERLLSAHALLHQEQAPTTIERQSEAELLGAVTRLAGAHDHVEELILQGRLQDARGVARREGRVAARQALEAVRRLVREERQGATRFVVDLARTSDRLYRDILVAALVAAVLSIVVAVSVTRSVPA